MPTGGRDFLRLMNDQTRRAADFDRRMRWTWLRKDLTAGTGDLVNGGDTVDEGDKGDVSDVIDLRPTEERAEPPQED